MAHDYAKQPKTRASRKAKSQVPGWVWLFTGTALGAFIMFLMRLSSIETSHLKSRPDQPAKTAIQEKDTAKQKPRFNFYNLLKENKVPIPEKRVDAPPHTTEKPATYILQVASFKSAADAEELRVKLILLNLESTAETVTVRNGETWHRVLVGPFASRSKLANARGKLVSNNYEALVLKRDLKKD